MAKFVTDEMLNAEVKKIFDEASEGLILISPFIKLNERLKTSLKNKINNHNLCITVVFGKNDDDYTKSISKEDVEFFKQFPNIEIRHESRLHAKYYANDNTALITSMNLYSFSIDHNIEVGILLKSTLLRNITGGLFSRITGGDNELDSQAFDYFVSVIENSELIYSRKPEYETKMLGFSNKYLGSKIIVDKTNNYFTTKTQHGKSNYMFEPKNAISIPSNISGFCIRTGKQITFNVKKPFTDEGYNSWSKYKNEEFTEKYCHFSGESSNGETSLKRPILKKNWQKAKDAHKF